MTHYSLLPPLLSLFVTKKRFDQWIRGTLTVSLLSAEPLLLDPYAGCLVPSNTSKDIVQDLHPYFLVTKFIDEKLLRTVSNIDGLKQVVFLTDGMDTRPYRLSWPPSTMIFDISLERVFETAAKKLEGVGAKNPRSCLFFHIPLESSYLKHSLSFKGFNGSRPRSCSLAMKGSIFAGELPGWLLEIGIGIKSETCIWMDKLFMSNGFRVELISYEEVAENVGKEFALRHYNNISFVAEQLQFSDDQMDTWRREFQRVDEGDEEGFEVIAEFHSALIGHKRIYSAIIISKDPFLKVISKI